jgi:hypothetical protein
MQLTAIIALQCTTEKSTKIRDASHNRNTLYQDRAVALVNY